MKKACILISLLFSFSAIAQQPYWQQKVNYNINVSLDDKKNSLTGFLDLDYTNNSPDVLNFIWFHIWPNAYKNDNTAFAKQMQRTAESKKRYKAMKEKGFIDSLDFKINDQKTTTEPDAENIDIIKVFLPAPLKPGQTIKITTPFFVKLPTYISRGGHYGQSYMACQWYPKPAVYDRQGWHPIPYLDQGEFFSEYGNYKVNITLPAQYVVGASGILQNADELETYRQLGAANYKTTLNKWYSNSAATKTLQYVAENVHDFAWFADKDFIIEYDTLQLSSSKVIDVFAYHHSKGNENWDKSTDYIKDGVRHYSAWIGEYPYKVVQAVEGPKNDKSGGMEYPMITMITMPEASDKTLDAIIVHEVGHNWFYGILGSNERDHAWMDEGINSYYQFRYEAEKYRSNTIFEKQLPDEVKQKTEDQFTGLLYTAFSKIPMEMPVDTPAYVFSGDDYGLIEYVKAATWMYVMQLDFGRENLDKAIQQYFALWMYKHPYPEDLQAAFEKSMNKNLDPYFELLKKKGNL